VVVAGAVVADVRFDGALGLGDDTGCGAVCSGAVNGEELEKRSKAWLTRPIASSTQVFLP
jgi:hypothetical protein